jgi:hypothetical protein
MNHLFSPFSLINKFKTNKKNQIEVIKEEEYGENEIENKLATKTAP